MNRNTKNLLATFVMVGAAIPGNAAASAALNCQFKNFDGELVFSISYELESSLISSTNGTATTFFARINDSTKSKIIWAEKKWAGEWGLVIFQFDEQDTPSMFMTTRYQKSKQWAFSEATLTAPNMYNDQLAFKGDCRR